MIRFRKLALSSMIAGIAAGGASINAYAQQESVLLEETVTIGSRNTKPRTVSDSPVPVDVFSAADFNAGGGFADITDNLNSVVPSYIASPATGDGSAFVRPTSLRGMASDQTLVLVNGTRRHRSALIHLAAPSTNSGSHGVDVAMIPGIALKSVEVLRDGAAAQYGSDAIAGVINLQLKDDDEAGSIEATYGEHFEGESSWQVSANKGFSLGGRGFLNLSINTNDNESLSRGTQRPLGQELIDGGAQGVGADAPFGDEPFIQSWGRPETSGTRFVFNMGFDIDEDNQVYLFGNNAQTKGRFRFFYRAPDQGDLVKSLAKGADNLARETEAGYTPFLDGDQSDASYTLGLRGVFTNETTYDASISYGINQLDYTLNNSLNGDADLVGSSAVRTFDTGDFEQEELTVNIDFGTTLSETLFLGYGVEYREETFTQKAGDQPSYVGGGSSGLGGTRPADAGENSRDNYAVYADLEHDITDDFMLQYALRYEDFSDFGSTLNGKIAGRYSITDSTALRGAVSTGFHAPTPGQSNLRSTTTTFDNNNNLIQVGQLPADSVEAIGAGAESLTEEEAVNISIGITSDLTDSTTLTIDAYQVEVDGRIYRTTRGKVSFFTNAIDVEHQGIDVVLTHDYSIGDVDNTLVFAYTHGEIEVTGNKLIGGVQVVTDDVVEDIETSYPEDKFTLTSNSRFGDFNLMLRARYFGDHYDQRGNIAGTADFGQSQEIDPVVYVDLELNYDVTEQFTVALGGSNIFDEYPDEIKAEDGVANRAGVGLPYPRYTPAGYEGGSWYVKARYNF